MFEFSYITFVSVFLILVLVLGLLKPKSKSINTDGTSRDPGLFRSRILAAKLRFLVHGHGMMEQRFDQEKTSDSSLQAKDSAYLTHSPDGLSVNTMLKAHTLSAHVAPLKSNVGHYSVVEIVPEVQQTHEKLSSKANKSIVTCFPTLVETLRKQLSQDLCSCSVESYTPYIAHRLMSSLTATACSTIFVGANSFQDKQWRGTFFEHVVKSHAIPGTLTQVLLDLCIRSSCTTDLRTEVEEGLRATNGLWSIQLLHTLKRMDIFLSESRRGSLTCEFATTGLEAPGSKIFNVTHLPTTQPNLSTSKYTQIFEANANSQQMHNQFANTANANYQFGRGRIAPPEQKCSDTITKLVLALLLLHFDFEIPSGQRTEELQKQKILFRRRV